MSSTSTRQPLLCMLLTYVFIDAIMYAARLAPHFNILVATRKHKEFTQS
jgi:hypothetical protein